MPKRAPPPHPQPVGHRLPVNLAAILVWEAAHPLRSIRQYRSGSSKSRRDVLDTPNLADTPGATLPDLLGSFNTVATHMRCHGTGPAPPPPVNYASWPLDTTIARPPTETPPLGTCRAFPPARFCRSYAACRLGLGRLGTPKLTLPQSSRSHTRSSLAHDCHRPRRQRVPAKLPFPLAPTARFGTRSERRSAGARCRCSSSCRISTAHVQSCCCIWSV